MKRVILLILTVLTIITLAACSKGPKNADPEKCYGYNFNLRVYDYYGDKYDNCDVSITSADKGNFKQSYNLDNGVCKVSLETGEYTVTVTDKESGKVWNENITVIGTGKKALLELRTEFGYKASKSTDMLLTEKREALIAEYGLVPATTVYEKESDYVDVTDPSDPNSTVGIDHSNFFSQDGILVTLLQDLDGDGCNELYLLRKADRQLISRVYYVADDSLTETEEVTQAFAVPVFGETVDMRSYLITAENELNICTEIYTEKSGADYDYKLDISVNRFAEGKLSPHMTLSGTGEFSKEAQYELITYTDGIKNNERPVSVDKNNTDISILPSELEMLGYPLLDADEASSADMYMGGYGNNCSYYDNAAATKLCRMSNEYIHSDLITGNDSYMKCTLTDNTDTNTMFGKLGETQEFEPMAIPSAYKEIIDLLINGKAYWAIGSAETGGIPGLPEVSNLYGNYESLSDIGYALIDIDKNGYDELLISGNGSQILDIYTLKDDKAVHLCNSSDTDKCHLNSRGIIWTGNEANGSKTWYKISSSGDKLEMTAAVFTAIPEESEDSKPVWYLSHTADNSDKTEITEAQSNTAGGVTDNRVTEYITFEEYHNNKEA